MQAEQQSERERFEERYPIWSGVFWNGSTYEVNPEYINSYRADRYTGQWEAWQARAALSHPSPQWLPIESAPKDATNVLLRDRGGHHADGYWLRSAYNGNGAWIWPFIHANPTHWQPLPPPPEQGSKG